MTESTQTKLKALKNTLERHCSRIPQQGEPVDKLNDKIQDIINKEVEK